MMFDDRLRRRLAELYENANAARRLAQMATMTPEHIDFNGSAMDFWGAILNEAGKRGKIGALVDAALGDYADDDVLLAWKSGSGTPADPGRRLPEPDAAELSYQSLQHTLSASGFHFVDVDSRPPGAVLWVHRLRPPNVVHGVFALAAAACTRAGLDVRLLLDDTQLIGDNRKRHQRMMFQASVERWFKFARGDMKRFSSALYSEIVSGNKATKRAWLAVNNYLNSDNKIIEYLVASKAINPAHPKQDLESLKPLIGDDPPIVTKRLLTPLWNWVVFELEIGRLLSVDKTGNGDGTIVTLGGMDERILWDMWHNGCDDSIAVRVKHIYLRTMHLYSDQSAWNQRPLSLDATRQDLLEFLRAHVRTDDLSLISWFLAAAVALPVALNEEFKHKLSSDLISELSKTARSNSGAGRDQTRIIPEIADAVREWFLP